MRQRIRPLVLAIVPGLTLLAALDAPVNRWIKSQLGHLPDGQLRTLIGLLERIRGNCE